MMGNRRGSITKNILSNFFRNIELTKSNIRTKVVKPIDVVNFLAKLFAGRNGEAKMRVEDSKDEKERGAPLIKGPNPINPY